MAGASLAGVREPEQRCRERRAVVLERQQHTVERELELPVPEICDCELFIHCMAVGMSQQAIKYRPNPEGEIENVTAGRVGERKPCCISQKAIAVAKVIIIMHRSCKNIDLSDWHVLLPWVAGCVRRHIKRYDFKKLLCTVGGLQLYEYQATMDGNPQLFSLATARIAKEAAKRIKEKNLALPPVKMEEKQDKSSFKVRIIGKESAMQQIFDHITCGASKEIWRRRIVPQQASSIKDRGQVYGAKMISRWIKRDQRSADWAKRHGYPYFHKCKYFVKLDAEKCYQNMRVDNFMRYFRRDCANTDLLRLWEHLLKSHQVNGYTGFMIGALPSQDACQYQMSFVYRFAMDLHKMRRGKSVKLISHMMTFMDDLLLFSASRRDLKMAVRKLIAFAKREFNIKIKLTWQICDMDETPVDMMGFLIHADGNVTVRPRIFLRTRRVTLRVTRHHGISYRQALRLCSYKGYFYPRKKIAKALPIKGWKVDKKYNFKKIFKKAAEIVSRHERGENHGNRIYHET